mgnify:CR=1 FL=1
MKKLRALKQQSKLALGQPLAVAELGVRLVGLIQLSRRSVSASNMLLLNSAYLLSAGAAVLAAPRLAHDLYLHDFFLHLSFFAQIRDVVGEPLATDEAATGETSLQPPNESDESTASLKVGHAALAATIADAQGSGFSELTLAAEELYRRGGSRVRVESGIMPQECAELFKAWQQAQKARVY